MAGFLKGIMENNYSVFAKVYDEFMDNVEYHAWSSFIADTLADYGIMDGLILDLGCGTGSMTELLAGKGYDMIGVDGSDEMLAQAMQKKEASGHEILYLCQDMREFELYGTVRAIVSVCDSMNYILEEEELLQVFRLVNNYLDPGGIFLFDMNTVCLYRDTIGDTVIAENREDASFIWENDFDEMTGINTYLLTLFIRQEGEAGDMALYHKYEELHVQRAYKAETVCRLLEEAGLELIGVYDGYSDREAYPESQRLLFLARERGKS